MQRVIKIMKIQNPQIVNQENNILKYTPFFINVSLLFAKAICGYFHEKGLGGRLIKNE
jgi:hypothetical protein